MVCLIPYITGNKYLELMLLLYVNNELPESGLVRSFGKEARSIADLNSQLLLCVVIHLHTSPKRLLVNKLVEVDET